MAGGGTGGFPPGGGGTKVGTGGLGTGSGAVPLGSPDDVGCASGLLDESTEKACVGHRELPDALVLGSTLGAGCFPFDTGGVAI